MFLICHEHQTKGCKDNSFVLCTIIDCLLVANLKRGKRGLYFRVRTYEEIVLIRLIP